MARDAPPHLYNPPYPPSSSHSHSFSLDDLMSGIPNIPNIPLEPLEPDSTMVDLIPDPDDDLPEEENIFRDMSFDEILEDLNARFLVNLPKEEMNLVRVYWQAEQAHWFYEDYLRPLNPLLPQLSQRSFTHLIIASSPLYSHLTEDDYDQVWDQYCRYKRMVPCCGGILINEAGDKVLMVRGWKSNAGWSFPRGKINSEESEEACAAREVEEETGFDLSGLINPKDRISTQISAQTITMFIVGGIREDTVFQTQTRKEIGAIEWIPFVDLPTWSGKKAPKTTGVKSKKFYNVTPFVGPLKRWMTEHGINPNPKRRKGAQAQSQTQTQQSQSQTPYRPLEPYFDADAGSPHIQNKSVSLSAKHDQTALDNLFHRFIHKQEEDLAHPDSVVGDDNQAGMKRLFQNIDVLKQEREANPTTTSMATTATTEQKEDDALARLLSGLGTASPAPRPGQVGSAAVDGKANKLLAMLNTPKQPPPSVPAQPAQPAHQASLLAMLSPKQTPDTPRAGLVDALHQPAGKPMSLPTSPRPPSPTQEARARKQRALLEQITAGIDVAPTSHMTSAASGGPISPGRHQVLGGTYMPQQHSYGIAPVDGRHSSDSKGSISASTHRISPQQHLAQHTFQQPSGTFSQSRVMSGNTPPGSSPQTQTARHPPPPYEQVPGPTNNFSPAHRPPQPSMALDNQHQTFQSSGTTGPAVNIGSLSLEQQNMLNTLRGGSIGASAAGGQSGALGKMPGVLPVQPNAAGPNVGYRPHHAPTLSGSGVSQYHHAAAGYTHPAMQGQVPTQGYQPISPNTGALQNGFGPVPTAFGGLGQGQGPMMAHQQQQQQPQLQQQQQHHPLPVRPPPNRYGPAQPTNPNAAYGYGQQVSGMAMPAQHPGGVAQTGYGNQMGGLQPGGGGGYTGGMGYTGQQGPGRGNGAQGIMIGPVGGMGGGTSNFHHPVPRPPNSQAGTLLGMLNDGPR